MIITMKKPRGPPGSLRSESRRAGVHEAAHVYSEERFCIPPPPQMGWRIKVFVSILAHLQSQKLHCFQFVVVYRISLPSYVVRGSS